MYVIDSTKVNWVALIDEGVRRAEEIMLQSMKNKRMFALLESYETENNLIAQMVTEGRGKTKVSNRIQLLSQ